jgi:hypothetical protein
MPCRRDAGGVFFCASSNLVFTAQRGSRAGCKNRFPIIGGDAIPDWLFQPNGVAQLTDIVRFWHR